jgi:nitroreductase/NAD-dependent dihydropyrimidine dehydrogenase PreA subunit
MSLIRIDSEKCKRDGICVEVCPARLLVMENKDNPPTTIEGAEELCIDCGHCVAVCPHGALTQRSMKPEDCTVRLKELAVSPEQAAQFLRSRRSIRVYKDETLSRETISGLIETARYAPSGHNVQPVEWLVIQDRAEIKRLAGITVDWMRQLWGMGLEIAKTLHMDRVIDAWDQGLDRICREAPQMVLTHAHKDNAMAVAASTIALTYLELTAYSQGLGACWAGYFNTAAQMHPPMIEALNLPEDHKVLGSLMLGRPKYGYQRIPVRRKPPIEFR